MSPEETGIAPLAIVPSTPKKTKQNRLRCSWCRQFRQRRPRSCNCYTVMIGMEGAVCRKYHYINEAYCSNCKKHWSTGY